jgi:hypothetical protein
MKFKQTLNRFAKVVGTEGTAAAEGGARVFATLPIFFYLFSLSIVVCLITKTEMTGLHWLSIAIIMIVAYVYLNKIEKKWIKSFRIYRN